MKQLDIPTLRSRYRQWIAGVLVVTAVAGVIALPLLPPRSQPVRWRGDPDLRHLVSTERPSVAIRYGLYEDLRVTADGATLIVPPSSIVFGYIARALSNVEVVERVYDPTAPENLPEPRFEGVHDGSGETVRYEILPGDDDVWWMAVDDDRVILIPASTAPAPGDDSG